MDMAEKEELKPPNRIRLLREKRGWELEDLADKVGVHRNTIERYENRKRDIDHGKMIELAVALECEPYEIIADKEDIIAAEASYLAKHRGVLNAIEAADEKVRNAIFELLGVSPTDAPKPRLTAKKNGTN